MLASDELDRQIQKVLIEHARSCQFLPAGGTGREGGLQRQFHAEIGGKGGGYFSGYGLLHGTNAKVGDFQMGAQFAARDLPPPGKGMGVVYQDLVFVWNDVMDVNMKYKSDPVFARTCRNLARCLGTGPPKDFILRIKWRADSAFQVMLGPDGKVSSSSYTGK
jgi:hypothetical protein